LAETTRRLPRRRWLRRAGLAAALAACYAAGLLTMHLLTPAPARGLPEERTPEPAPPAVAATTDPAALAQAADPGRVAALRRAGDHYLTEEIDPEAALRCYARALDAGSADDAKFSPEDNWLLMAIKIAREKEAHDAN
jgi:anti-sigma factor RsiW